MIDIVYTLGTGSTWQDNELRYSLRSVQKYLKNYRNIYIVGECPDWIQNVIHIPAVDTTHASKNILNKILIACADEFITPDFLFFNDDFFLLQDADAPTYPYYFDKTVSDQISKYSKSNYYLNYLLETKAALDRYPGEQKYFDIHTPIVYNRSLIRTVSSFWKFEKQLLIKTLYCNSFKIPGIQKTDCKIIGKRNAHQVEAETKNQSIFSIGDQCLLDWSREESPVKTLLKNLFPDKSKYEK